MLVLGPQLEDCLQTCWFRGFWGYIDIGEISSNFSKCQAFSSVGDQIEGFQTWLITSLKNVRLKRGISQTL